MFVIKNKFWKQFYIFFLINFWTIFGEPCTSIKFSNLYPEIKLSIYQEKNIQKFKNVHISINKFKQYQNSLKIVIHFINCYLMKVSSLNNIFFLNHDKKANRYCQNIFIVFYQFFLCKFLSKEKYKKIKSISNIYI